MISLINGIPGDTISISDRGLQYGDGVFETLYVKNAQIVLWPLHKARLQQSCQRLAINLDMPLLEQELADLLNAAGAEGIAKIIVTRGEGGRGYFPDPQLKANRILQFYPSSDAQQPFQRAGVTVLLCQHRISSSASSEGLKHLNRLDQVIASGELGERYNEGLLRDSGANIIEGCKSNVFMVLDDNLITPDLSCAGVNGVMRQYLIKRFQDDGRSVRIDKIKVADLKACSEVFMCNSVVGIWPVIEIHALENKAVEEHFSFSVGRFTRQALSYSNEAFDIQK